MPSALRRHQYELCDPTGEGLLIFGTEDTGYLTTTRPGFESADLVVADSSRPMEDGWMAGRDYLSSGGRHTFEIGVLTDPLNGLAPNGAMREQVNVDYIDVMKALWRDKRWRNKPGAYAILRKAMADGSIWITYGRPRKFDPVEGNMTAEGYTPVLCDFDAFEEGWFSDTVQEYGSIVRYDGDDGGLVAPLVAPLTTTAATASTNDGGMVVGGSRPTWPKITFYGPALNPSVVVGQSGGLPAITYGLNGQVGYNEAIAIETAPWARSVRRVSDGAPKAGMLSAATPPMADCAIPPGPKTLTYKATDATGTSYVTVAWRDARAH